jgi:exodeoxyribonuclease V alpha subunit
VAPDPLLGELIHALTAALEEGVLELRWADPAPAGIASVGWPEAHREALERSGLAADPASSPMRLTAVGVGWRRWIEQLDSVLEEILRRGRTPLTHSSTAGALERAVRDAGDRGRLDPRQRQAVDALLRHRLVLLGGGPGTGKTTTVVEMLGAAIGLRPGLRLHLAAPTGKAAARLRQAIAERSGTLPIALADRLRSVPCTTLHRLLESRGDGFRRDRQHPLTLDLLVVDEVSMVDLPLTAALLEALPAEAQLLLVGDPAQLPPVGPGAVLVELNAPERLAQLEGAAVQLATPYRNDGAIALAAAPLRANERQSFLTVLEGLGPGDNLLWRRCEPPGWPQEVSERLAAHQAALRRRALAFDPEDPATGQELLRELEDCVLLTPLRRGAWGVEGLHRRLLGEAATQGPMAWPIGTPVLCTRNLPDQDLANGDVGVVVAVEGGRRLLFGSSGPEAGGMGSNGVQVVHPARLAGAEPALAITIHKAQGSQYREVLLLMPASSRWEPRLLYTGLTRAREKAVLITPPDRRWIGAGG